MFVTTNNFLRLPYRIPNVSANTGFNSFADELERDVLEKLLGDPFYTEFEEAFEDLPDDWSPTETYLTGNTVVSGNNIYVSLQDANTNHEVADPLWWDIADENNKWLLLINGTTYELYNETFRWRGMVDLLKPYIYSKYVEFNREDFSGTGTVESANENSEVVSPINQITNSWNSFARKFGSDFRYSNTLYGYLLAVEDNFTNEVVFKDLGRKNFAGL